MWALILLAALLVFAVVAGALQFARARRLAHQADQRDQAAAAASALGVALFTYSYQDPQATLDRILALSTPAFGRRQSSSAAALEAGIRADKATGRATVVRAFVTDVTGNTAGAAVDLDTTSTSTAGSTHVTRLLRIELQRLGGLWKVDGVQVFAPAG